MHLLNHMVGNQVPPSILSVKRPASHQRSRTSRTHSCLQSLGMCVAALVFSTCVPPLPVLPNESFGQLHADYNSPIKNHNITRSEWYDRQCNWDKKELKVFGTSRQFMNKVGSSCHHGPWIAAVCGSSSVLSSKLTGCGIFGSFGIEGGLEETQHF